MPIANQNEEEDVRKEGEISTGEVIPVMVGRGLDI